MKQILNDDTIEMIRILSKLTLTEDEKQQAKIEMDKILDYMEQLNELNTEGVEPLTHLFQTKNVLRPDVITNQDDSIHMLINAPNQWDNCYKVPKTVE